MDDMRHSLICMGAMGWDVRTTMILFGQFWIFYLFRKYIATKLKIMVIPKMTSLSCFYFHFKNVFLKMCFNMFQNKITSIEVLPR